MSLLKNALRTLSLLSAGMMASHALYAARPVDLSKETFVSPTLHAFNASTLQPSGVDIISRHTDQNQVTHIRMQQMYDSYPVWGADAIAHVAKMNTARSLSTEKLVRTLTSDASIPKNGIFYADLASDLTYLNPKEVNTDAQKNAAIASFKQRFKEMHKTDTFSFSHEKANVVVFIDDQQKARYAYLVTFLATRPKHLPKKPVAIIDVQNQTVYKQWDDVKTQGTKVTPAQAVGFGGNPLLGLLEYGKDKPVLTVRRIEEQNTCVFQNDDVQVLKYTDFHIENEGMEISFPCVKPIEGTSNYLESEKGYMGQWNGAYSPMNDALHYGLVIKKLYQEWYGITVLTEQDKVSPLLLRMNLFYLDNAEYENAFWLPETRQMYFGLGGSQLYPLVTMSIAAHEISHGFTEQHSNLVYENQSGALNESFSDMASAAASYYESHETKTDWTLGEEVVKSNVGKNPNERDAIRYFSSPKKDGASIEHVKDYKKLERLCSQASIDPSTGKVDPDQFQSCMVHYASGVFNKAFYTLATTPGWNTKLAFAVMVKANQDYWTSTENFESAACGVKKAAMDILKTNPAQVDDDLKKAFGTVGVSLKSCTK